MRWLPVVLLLVPLAACSSFGTTQDRWTDRYRAQEEAMKSIKEMRQAQLSAVLDAMAGLKGESRGIMLALLATGFDYRDYADVLAAITPPDPTSGEIISKGVANVLPMAVMGATMGWMSGSWASKAGNETTVGTDARRSYSSGGDMGFKSWNPATTTTTTYPPPVIAPAQ